jgi:hypothetical protein
MPEKTTTHKCKQHFDAIRKGRRSCWNQHPHPYPHAHHTAASMAAVQLCSHTAISCCSSFNALPRSNDLNVAAGPELLWIFVRLTALPAVAHLLPVTVGIQRV